MSNNFKLVDNDLVIGRGMERVEGINYVAQLTKNRLLTILSEWDLDETLGIDWFNIMGANYDLSIIQGLVSQTIRETKGVDKLNSLDIELDKPNRKVIMTFIAVGNGEVFTETITI